MSWKKVQVDKSLINATFESYKFENLNVNVTHFISPLQNKRLQTDYLENGYLNLQEKKQSFYSNGLQCVYENSFYYVDNDDGGTIMEFNTITNSFIQRGYLPSYNRENLLYNGFVKLISTENDSTDVFAVFDGGNSVHFYRKCDSFSKPFLSYNCFSNIHHSLLLDAVRYTGSDLEKNKESFLLLMQNFYPNPSDYFDGEIRDKSRGIFILSVIKYSLYEDPQRLYEYFCGESFPTTAVLLQRKSQPQIDLFLISNNPSICIIENNPRVFVKEIEFVETEASIDATFSLNGNTGKTNIVLKEDKILIDGRFHVSFPHLIDLKDSIIEDTHDENLIHLRLIKLDPANQWKKLFVIGCDIYNKFKLNNENYGNGDNFYAILQHDIVYAKPSNISFLLDYYEFEGMSVVYPSSLIDKKTFSVGRYDDLVTFEVVEMESLPNKSIEWIPFMHRFTSPAMLYIQESKEAAKYLICCEKLSIIVEDVNLAYFYWHCPITAMTIKTITENQLASGYQYIAETHTISNSTNIGVRLVHNDDDGIYSLFILKRSDGMIRMDFHLPNVLN